MSLYTDGSEKDLVKAREAARRLGISSRTLWNLTNQGLIPAVRIGRAVRYRPETLRTFAEEREDRHVN